MRTNNKKLVRILALVLAASLLLGLIPALVGAVDLNSSILGGKYEAPKDGKGVTAEIYLPEDATLVAIGDDAAYYTDKGNYVSMVATKLGVDYVNLAKDKMADKSPVLIQNAMPILENAENQKAIQEAEIVTVGFSKVAILKDVSTKIMDSTEPAWSTYLTPDQITMVQTYLQLAAMEMGVASSSKAMNVVKHYLYNCLAYSATVPAYVKEIRKLNADALIVIVGMYNPLDGVTLNFEGKTIELTEMFDTMIDGMAKRDLELAQKNENVMFVYCPDVATRNTSKVLSEMGAGMMLATGKNITPNKAGHETIANKIVEALTLLEEAPVPPTEPTEPTEPPTEPTEPPTEPTEPPTEAPTQPPKARLGDVDGDGIIDSYDATLIMQYDAWIIDETKLDLAAADVSGEGDVDTYDAALILQFDVMIIADESEFPGYDAYYGN